MSDRADEFYKFSVSYSVWVDLSGMSCRWYRRDVRYRWGGTSALGSVVQCVVFLNMANQLHVYSHRSCKAVFFGRSIRGRF